MAPNGVRQCRSFFYINLFTEPRGYDFVAKIEYSTGAYGAPRLESLCGLLFGSHTRYNGLTRATMTDVIDDVVSRVCLQANANDVHR